MIEKIKNEGNIKDYKIIEKIGKGGFSCVFKVMNKKDEKIYALKQIYLDKGKKEELEQLKNEANILSTIENEYIVKYYDSFVEEKTFNIIMEYCEGLDLRKLIIILYTVLSWEKYLSSLDFSISNIYFISY